MEKQTLYHGSNVIVEHPLVSIGRKDYINGYAGVEHTLRQLVYHKPNYQICILSQDIVDKYLQFKSYERV